jgi:hypothetical protein
MLLCSKCAALWSYFQGCLCWWGPRCWTAPRVDLVASVWCRCIYLSRVLEKFRNNLFFPGPIQNCMHHVTSFPSFRKLNWKTKSKILNRKNRRIFYAIQLILICFNIMLAVFYACMCLYAHLCMPGVNVVLSLLLFSSVGYGQDMGYGQGKWS